MKNRETVIRNASELADFGADFDMSVVYGLQNNMRCSVDVLATYGLGRVQAWLWPLVKGLAVNEELQVGPFKIVAAEQRVATNRDPASQTYYAYAEGRRWQLVWSDVEGRHSAFGVGVDPEGFFSAAYCEFGDTFGGPVIGGVSGRGSEIKQVFDFLVLAGEAMPSSASEIDSGILRSSWEFDDIREMVEFDGRLGATFGGELHHLAEQRASKILCDIAANNALQCFAALNSKGFIHDKSFLRCKDVTVFALDVADQPRVAFYSERFPGGEWDRYISWCDIGSDGAVSRYHTYLLPFEKQVSDAVSEFRDGTLTASVTHDFGSGQTSFSDTVTGYNLLATATIFLHEDTHLLTHLPDDGWERSERFDDLDYRFGKAPANRR